jgi:hypothetical protein
VDAGRLQVLVDRVLDGSWSHPPAEFALEHQMVLGVGRPDETRTLGTL